MNIGMWIPDLLESIGGAETYLLYLAEVLNKDNNVLIITRKKNDCEEHISEIYKKYGVPNFNTEFVLCGDEGKYRKHRIMRRVYSIYLSEQQCKAITYIAQKHNIELFINGKYGVLRAPKNIKSIHIIHFPVMIRNRLQPHFRLQRYLNSYDLLVANSEFTKYYIALYYGRTSSVLYPPIRMKKIANAECSKKENIILAVDRLIPDKKIIEMVEAFNKLQDIGVSNYKFVIIGNRDTQYFDYYNKIKSLCKNNIEIYSDLSNQDLLNWYKKAKIFWHAKGLDVSEDNPFRMEHFGMTTVESMANGCVPIVINKAGQCEIVENGVSGFKWDSIEELIEYTCRIINDEKMYQSMQQNSIERSETFLMDAFTKRTMSILKQLK